jgi:hypothetical protein
MRTLATILCTVGGWLTWPGWAYAAPRHLGPWRYYYRYPFYRYPSTSDERRIYTPIRDMELGHHLNFRDPDGIALELDAPNELAMKAQRALASGQTTPAEIAAFLVEHFGRDYVPAGLIAHPGTRIPRP